MADSQVVTVDRRIILPDGQRMTVRVPESWDQGQVMSALQERGVIPSMTETPGPSETPSEKPPAPTLTPDGPQTPETRPPRSLRDRAIDLITPSEGIGGFQGLAMRMIGRSGNVAEPVGRGGLRAVQEQINAANEAIFHTAESVEDLMKLGGFVWGDEGGLRYLNHREWREHQVQPARLDVVQSPDEQGLVGDMVESASQFMAGYFTGGAALRGAGILQEGGKKASYLRALLQGAFSDSMAFDPQDPLIIETLGDLGVPVEPVTTYLQNPEQPDAERRMVRALEGAGVGILADGIMRMGGAAVRAMRRQPPEVAPTNAGTTRETTAIEQTGQKDRYRFDHDTGEWSRVTETPPSARAPDSPEGTASFDPSDFSLSQPPMGPEEAGRLISQSIRTKAANMPPVAKQGMSGDKKIFVPRVAEQVTRDITQAAELALEGNTDQSKRLFQKISQLMHGGEVSPEYLPEVLRKYDMTPEQFAEEWAATISAAGRNLSYLSKLSRSLAKTFEDSPEASRYFKRANQDARSQFSKLDWVADKWTSLEQARRIFLVTQLATAMRNVTFTSIRGALSVFDETLQAVLNVPLRGVAQMMGGEVQGRSLMADFKGNLNAASTMYRHMTPSGRDRLNEILSDNAVVMSKVRLLSQPVQEVSLQGIGNTLNWANRVQEHFFRKFFFEARLRQLLARRGMDFDTVQPKQVPQEIFEDAVDYALEMTTSRSATSQVGKDVINFFNRYLTLINPFPRFTFANALRFVYEHSPVGFLRAINPDLWKEFQKGNTDEMAKILSRTALGWTMLLSAWEIRQSDMAGEKWYEIKWGDKIIDIRPYAPLSFYFLLADTVQNIVTTGEGIDYAAWFDTLVGMNRIQGTGLEVFNLMRFNTMEEGERVIASIVGQYLGSWSVSARTAKDVVSFFDPEEAILRDLNSHPWIGPFINNLPYASRLLPEGRIPYREGTISTEHPLLRQLTGVSPRSKTQIERYRDKFDIPASSLRTYTGNPEINRLVDGYTGWYAERFLEPYLQSEEFKSLLPSMQKTRLKELMTVMKRAGLQNFRIHHPDLSNELMIEKMDDDTMEILRDLGAPVDQWFDRMRGK